MTCYSCEAIYLKMISVLEHLGTPLRTAKKVARVLIINELNGYSSHGVLRILQYVKDVEAGLLNVTAKPNIKKRADNIFHIEGNFSFGILVIDCVIHTLVKLSRKYPITAVSVNNSHHLGRLNKIGLELAKKPNSLFTLGFCNYLGGGARVAPPQQQIVARLSTNPLLFAFPSYDKSPFVLDISTSVTSEGYVANARARGEQIAPGILIDKDAHPILDPNTLYASPPTATLAPLGYPLVAHKGYGLAVFIEAVIGILAGSHNICSPIGNGNGLFIIAINPYLIKDIHNVGQLGNDIIQACYGTNFLSKVQRYPGKESNKRKCITKKTLIDIPAFVYEQIMQLYITP